MPRAVNRLATMIRYFLGLFLFGALQVRLFALEMECETYRVEGSQKVDRTIFTFKYNPENDQVSYKKVSGRDWVIPDGTKFNLVWKSKDRLRFVTSWIDIHYENDGKVWHPVFLLDLDFSQPRFSIKTAGGFSDFDEIVEDPWKFEFRRRD